MKTIIFAMLQMILASGILYGYYHLVLRNKKFHQYNRFYLLAAVLISVFIPFFNIPVYFEDAEIRSSVVLQTLQTISYSAQENNVTGYLASPQVVSAPFDWNIVFYCIYALIGVLLLTRIFISLKKIRAIIKRNPVEELDGIRFINTVEPGTPYSFFRWLFWNKAIELRSEKGERIFRHEVFHIQQKHTLDILALELLTVFLWINPFFFLIKKELKAIHEFLADEFAMNKTERWEYAELLLMQVLNTKQNLVNPFFHNQIKRRIAMITNPQKTSHRYLRKLLVLPVTALVLTLFAFKYKNRNAAGVVRSDETITIVVDAGHGGIDPGAKSPDEKYTEAQLNLELSKVIQSLAGEYNVKVVMTRENDQLPGGATNKQAGLLNRVKIAAEANPMAVISVHVNAAGSQSSTNQTGIEAYITKNRFSLYDSKLASTILSELSDVYKTKKEINQRQETGVFILDNGKSPSVLLECGYINNTNDLAFITNSENQEKIARAILSGMVKYSKEKITFNQVVPSDTVPGVIEVYSQRPSPPKRHPSSEQLKTWGDAKMYGVWLDGKRIDNSILSKRNPSDFSYYSVSKLEKNAINYGKHYYQVDLMSLSYYEKAFPDPILVREVMLSDTSLPTSNPLIVIDGKVYPGLAINRLDNVVAANNIESINVWKDTAAIARYGSRGKNGVIEIFTKSKKVKDVEIREVTLTDIKPDADNIIFEKVEIEPAFPGGAAAWRRYLERNLDAEAPTKNHAPDGKYTVYIEFVIRKDGKIGNTRPLTHHGFGMEENVIETIKKGPSWNAGIQNGHTVNLYKRQVVIFEINNTKKDYGPTIEKTSNSLDEVVIVCYGKNKVESEKEITIKEVTLEDIKADNDNPIFEKVEIEATFPGGESAWKKYLERNLIASVPVENNAPKGEYTIYIQFAVHKDGSIGDIKPLTNHGFGMEQEAMRMIRKGPKWIPAIQNGKAVDAYKKQRFDFAVIKETTSVPSPTSGIAKLPSGKQWEEAAKTPSMSLAELKNSSVYKLLQVPAGTEIVSYTCTFELDNGSIKEIVNYGDKFSSSTIGLINNLQPPKTIAFEKILIKKDGAEKKIAGKIYQVVDQDYSIRN